MSMNEPLRSRPLGLTLLALTNFLLGGVFAWLALLALIILNTGSEEAGGYWVLVLNGGAIAFTGILSGVGYLRLRPLTGRSVGTFFGFLCLVYFALKLANGGGTSVFDGLMVLIGLGNIALVTTVYKKAFYEA